MNSRELLLKTMGTDSAAQPAAGAQFDWIASALEDLKAAHLRRSPRKLEALQGVRARIAGREVTLFCGNDYLGFARHPRLIRVFKEAADVWGVGMCSARLISGTSEWHVALESRISRFLGKERALLFSSGCLANLGTLSALAGNGDLIAVDKLSHASLLDACRLSNAALRVYPHGNLRYLESLLERSKASRKWIVTDSFFSMDGDLAPLAELVHLKNRFGAGLVIDEAHATGVFGARGRGAAEHAGVSDEIDVHIGTCSKAIGSIGGFVAGSAPLIDFLTNRARTFIFDTALPAPVCRAACEAFDLIEEEPELRRRLHRNASLLREGLASLGVPALSGEGPIIPIPVGSEEKALRLSETLFQKGFLVPAVRYPTVAKGKARLRLTVSEAHSESEIKALLNAISNGKDFFF